MMEKTIEHGGGGGHVAVARVIRFGAMAGRLTTAAHHGRDGTGPQVAEEKKLLQESGSFCFKSVEGVRHE